MFRTVSFRFLTNTHTDGSHLSYGAGFETSFGVNCLIELNVSLQECKESIALDGNKL